jgi:hypothetical protein
VGNVKKHAVPSSSVHVVLPWNIGSSREYFSCFGHEKENCIQINKLNSKKKKKGRKQIKVNNNNKQRSFLYDCNKTIFMWLLSSVAVLITCIYIYIKIID